MITPFAFIRENVQNAVDAIRLRAHREGTFPDEGRYRIDVDVTGQMITVRDNGIGMSAEDLQRFFWTIGASGKRTSEALAAGCVGTFGIGGFANFGVCSVMEVISQPIDSEEGTLTRLTEADIKSAGANLPRVIMEKSDLAAPGGTVVVGHPARTAKCRGIKGLPDRFREICSCHRLLRRRQGFTGTILRLGRKGKLRSNQQRRGTMERRRYRNHWTSIPRQGQHTGGKHRWPQDWR